MEFHEIIQVEETPRTKDVYTNCSFESLMISSHTVENMYKHGFRIPSPVQEKAIPTGLMGLDLLVQAKSGTGKTLVFAVLAVENINLKSNDPQKIIIVPTREIASQIKDTIKKIAHFKTKISVFVGGTPVNLNIQTLKTGVHIIIGTTGRICQLVDNGHLNMNSIDLFVLDEADKLMDNCFQKDINFLFSTLPPSRQVAVFSATYPRELDKTLAKFMRDASLIRLNADNVQLIGIKQYAVIMYQPVLDSLEHLLKSIQFNQALIFCNNHQACAPTTSRLNSIGFTCSYISSYMSQVDRDNVIEQLKKYKLKVLVSTDLTARGIDVENVNLVVNLEAAVDPETYFHRIGRAARYGGYGAAVTLLQDSKSLKCFMALVRLGNADVRILSLTNIPPDLTTNQSFYDRSAPFTSHELKNTSIQVIGDFGEISQALSVTENYADNRYCYDRSTILDIGKLSFSPSDQLRQKIIELDLTMVSCFANDLQRLAQQINAQKSSASVHSKNVAESSQNNCSASETKPKKYKFVPTREKAKKKFYMKGELIAIRDSFNDDIWRTYAASRFDINQEPFVSTIVSTGSNLKDKVQISPNKSTEVICHNGKQRLVKKPLDCTTDTRKYTRKDMIALQMKVPKAAWIVYVKSKWDTTEEPWQLDQRLRCSFEEQLRRQRHKEKMQRTQVMQDRIKAIGDKPKVIASARTPSRIDVNETTFDAFCTRLNDQFNKFKAKVSDNPSNIGPVVPLRDPVPIWQYRWLHYSEWLRNFDLSFKYNVRKGANRVHEVSVGVENEEMNHIIPGPSLVGIRPIICANGSQESVIDKAVSLSGVSSENFDEVHESGINIENDLDCIQGVDEDMQSNQSSDCSQWRDDMYINLSSKFSDFPGYHRNEDFYVVVNTYLSLMNQENR